LSAGDPYAVLSSTPGKAKPIFRTVSKLMVLLGMGDSDYPQEHEPFQDRLLQLRVFGFGLLQDGSRARSDAGGRGARGQLATGSMSAIATSQQDESRFAVTAHRAVT